ncbi:MAG: 4Fe-4S binding protein [Bacteroidales bacterium]|nr:4Fe-4S binding protein [Bacteroidales bacterium]
MLRKVRAVGALVCFLAITLLFLDFTGVLQHYLSWVAKMQFFPAVMAGNLFIIALVLVVTLFFGRWYCSVLCPLGVMQDGFNWVARMVKKNRFHYVRERAWLRYGVLGVFVVVVVLAVLGVVSMAFPGLIEPYSAFGRVVTNLFQPLYQWINNMIAQITLRHEIYAFYPVDVWLKSITSLAVALLTFVLIGVLALLKGRSWCSNICPVGTLLGLVSRFSLYKPVIDSDKCKRCKLCEKNCKASCIDVENQYIDYSRCVACMDCIGQCKFDALRYRNSHFRIRPELTSPAKKKEEKVDDSRRKFLATSAIVVATSTVAAQEKKIDGGLAVVENKKIPHRDVPLKPAGSISVKHFASHCTACQLCVSECPNHVLRPSDNLESLMQPEMSYERGFCRPECTRCSQVCPTGAIRPITPDEKTDIHFGFASVIQDNCVAYRGVNCGNCARHCPSEAIQMVARDPNANPDDPTTLKVPSVITEKCTGCGACEYLCPSRPFSAIFVTGREVHN